MQPVYGTIPAPKDAPAEAALWANAASAAVTSPTTLLTTTDFLLKICTKGFAQHEFVMLRKPFSI
jgi:hypothetical protein